MFLGVVQTSSMLFLACVATATDTQSVITISTVQDAVWESCSNNGLPLVCLNQKPFGYVVLKPRPLLEALVPRFQRKNRVTDWITKCESRREDDAKKRPVCAPC